MFSALRKVLILEADEYKRNAVQCIRHCDEAFIRKPQRKKYNALPGKVSVIFLKVLHILVRMNCKDYFPGGIFW